MPSDLRTWYKFSLQASFPHNQLTSSHHGAPHSLALEFLTAMATNTTSSYYSVSTLNVKPENQAKVRMYSQPGSCGWKPHSHR